MSTDSPARLVVQSAQGHQEFPAGATVTVGREKDCDVVVDDPQASRHHLVFRPTGDTWTAVDSSSGGTFVAGRRVPSVPLGPTPVALHLGGHQAQAVTAWAVPAVVSRPAPPAPHQQAFPAAPPASAAPPGASYPAPAPPPPVGQRPYTGAPPPSDPPQVAQAKLPPGQLAHGRTMLPVGVSVGRSLTIGRERGNDIVLDDPLVSRHHARLDVGTPTVLHDLGSFNGTFVDGRRVQGAAPLVPGSEVIVGNQTFRWDGGQLVTTATQHEFTLYADGLSVVVDGGKRLLDDMTFQLDPSTLTAVIGPSGAGKSTLLGALTGLRPASHGRVIWQGHDLYQNYDQLRFQIGLVPQQDIQHPQLKVKQALGFAAELRLPPDTTPPEREQRVHQVAGQLQLLQRLDNRIGTQLSGGQKKRVSIATELLTAPPLLFLDEPTSGLDPGLDLEVMRQLRSLADDGRVVMVVTHSVLALDVCDNVMVLAPGGRIAYFGPPAGVLDHFGVGNYPQVFDMLDDADLWQRIDPHETGSTGALPAPAAAVPAPPKLSFAKQLSTLVRRNVAVVMADRLLLTMLIALPLVLGALSRLVPGDDGLSLDATRTCPPGTRSQGGDCLRPDPSSLDGFTAVREIFGPGEATQRLIVLIVAACLMGTAIAIRELVGERPIFRREYAVGLSPDVYLVSKILVLGTAAFVQGLLVTLIATVGLPGADGRLGTLRIALVIGLLAFTMAVVGLALSALVTSTEQTMPALVGVIMVQLVLSGSLFAIAGRPLLEQVAWLSPSRWAYAATASAMGLTRAQPDRDEDWIALAGAGHYLLDVVVLLLLCAASIGAGLWLTRRSATGSD